MRRRNVLSAMAAVCWSGCAFGQLRIVDYNTSNDSGFTRTSQFQTIVQAIAAESVNGVAKMPDVYVVEEQSYTSGGNSASTTAIVSFLNGIYGSGTYAAAVANFDSSNDTVQSVIYKTASVSLISKTVIGSTSTQNGKAAGAREDGKYVLRPVGYTSASDIYIYASHTKASQGTDSGATVSNANRRRAEGAVIRADIISNVPTGANVIVAGDLNLYNPQEGFYTTITATGSGQMVDPLHLSTSWSGVIAAHTQSPATSSYYGGQVTGGMDDRFDFQLVSPGLSDGNGVALIPGSYHAFGNNGTHQLNGAITTGTGASAAVLLAEAQFTDHIPVVADYQLPARMTVGNLAATSAVILRGTPVTTTIGVANSANVVAAVGADELTYSIAASGALSGSTTGSVLALAGAQNKTLALATSAAGPQSGSVTVTATGQQVPDAPVTRSVSYTVVDPSNASFSFSSDVNARTLDFGVVRVGDSASQPVSIYNLQATSGYTADLALTSTVRRQEFPGGITFNATTFGAISGGEASVYFATVDTTAPHTWDVSYQMTFADAATVYGGTASQSALTLNLSAKVVAFANGAPAPMAQSLSLPTVARIADVWQPTSLPTATFGAGLTEGTVLIDPQSLITEATQIDVRLQGDDAAIAAALADWTLDGQLHGYTLAPQPDGDLWLTFAPADTTDGFAFSWNLTGTGASVASIAVVPEPAALAVLAPALALIARRRR